MPQSELETYKALYSLLKEKISLLEKRIACNIETIADLDALVKVQEELISVQAAQIKKLSGIDKGTHLKLIK